MPHIPENWAELLTPGLRMFFERTLDETVALHKRQRIFNVLPSQRAYEEAIGAGGLSNKGWNLKATGRVQYDRIRKLFPVEFRHIPYAKGIQIERELIEDNLYPGLGLPTSITETAGVLAENAEVWQELSAAEVFNSAATDSGTTLSGFSMTGPDGVGLSSTAHPDFPGASATQSNEFDLALDATNLKTIRTAGRRIHDDQGNPVRANWDIVVVPPELEDAAMVIRDSANQPGTANNDANTVGRRIREIIEWDYLTDAARWYGMDDRLRARQLHWFNRNAMEFKGQESFDTLRGKWRCYHRFSRGWTGWQFMFSSKAA